VRDGLDPHDDCEDKAATEACAADGQCDGAGACRKAARGRLCAQPTCLDAHTFSAAGICDGAGHCFSGARIDCGAYLCGDDGCAKPCTDSAACPNGSYCANGICEVRRGNGQVCGADGECESGFCSAERICCDGACGGTCMACAAAATGQPDGTCAPVRAGIDPRADCPADREESCGRNGACDGSGRCDLYGAGTVCAPATCDPGGRFTATRTCGGGACAAAATEECGLSVCDVPSGCRRGCAADGDCIESSYCDTAQHTCAAKRANGASCGARQECLSGNCVDRVCCNSPCAGPCASCLAVENGQQADGTCGDVVEGTDPENECAPSPAACGLDGFCGHGRCRFATANATCTGARCVNAPGNTSAMFTPAAPCDGQGACLEVTSRPCPGSVRCLSDRECLPSVCGSDVDCLGGFYCAAGTCTAQKTLGSTCSADDQCATGSCPEGSQGDAVCCATPCPLACQGCSLAATGAPTGTCAPRLANATAVCGGACRQDFGLCSSGISCQETAWTFDESPPQTDLPYAWAPDSMSGILYSSKWNHTPGGYGSLGVIAGPLWDAAPGIVLCEKDPNDRGNYSTSMNLGGKMLDAWVLFDGPPTTAVCLFQLYTSDFILDELRVLSFVAQQPGLWYQLHDTVPLRDANLLKLLIRCVLDDGWPGTLYIDDVSIR